MNRQEERYPADWTSPDKMRSCEHMIEEGGFVADFATPPAPQDLPNFAILRALGKCRANARKPQNLVNPPFFERWHKGRFSKFAGGGRLNIVVKEEEEEPTKRLSGT